MARRGENIRKRADGRWEGRCRIQDPVTQTVSYKSIYGSTYREVKEKKLAYLFNVMEAEKKHNSASQNGDELHETKDETKRPEVSPKDKVLLHDLLTKWLDDSRFRLKGSTQAKYEYMIASHINPDLGDIPVDELTTAALDDFMEKKLSTGRKSSEEGLSESYVRTMMLIIDSALHYGMREDICSLSKLVVHKPSRIKKEVQVLDNDAQSRLTDWIVDHPSGTSIGILLSLYAGLRISEVCALKWSDIDFPHSLLTVNHTIARVKNPNTSDGTKMILTESLPKSIASIRTIPLSPFLMNMILKIREESLSDYVISQTDHFVNPRTYEKHYHRILKECQVDDINYHALRHTFATRCIDSGVDIKTLSEVLGHSNVSITLNTYVHSSLKTKRIQLDKLTADLYKTEPE